VRSGTQEKKEGSQIKFGNNDIFINKKQNMIQPNYSPKEALEKMKLLMKYDTSKTLNENVEVIKEQNSVGKTAVATGVGVGTGVAYGAAASAGALGGLGTAAAGTSLALGTTIAPTLGAAGAAALGAGIIVGAAALALTPLVIWYMDKDNARPKVERIIKYCVSDKDKISKVPRKVADTTIRDLSDKLYDAMEGLGTDEEAVYGVFKSLETASDFCALVDRFNKDYGNRGDLLEWLDDDFDASSEWEQIFRPIRNVVEDTLLTIKDDTVEDICKTNPNDPSCKKDVKKEEGGGGGGGARKSKYTSCPETFPIKQTCKNNKIKEIQACLNMPTKYQTGNFGPITQGYLEKANVSGTEITQDSYDKVCNKNTSTVTTDNSDVDQVDSDNVDDIYNS
jgi:hypothetical protein